MTAVEDLHPGPVGVDLRQHRGHELLFGLLMLQGGLYPCGDLHEVQRVVCRLTEGTKDHRGRPRRRESLTQNIADDEPDAAADGDGLVQIAADPGRGGGGDIPDRDVHWRDPARYRTQQDLLCRFRDGLEIREFPFAPSASRTGDDPGYGHSGDRDQGNHASPGTGEVVVDRQQHAKP